MSNSEPSVPVARPDAKKVMEGLRPVANNLEIFRKEALAKRSRGTLIAAGILLTSWLVAFGIISGSSEAMIGGVICGVLGTVIAGVVYSQVAGSAKKEYISRFKRELFSKAVSIANPGMDYHPSSMVPKTSFKDGGLFNSRIDRYEGEDAFRGTVGSTELLFSELHVQMKETTRDSKGHSRTRWVTVFKGLYLIADFHKEFTFRVKIMPDVAEATFGWIGRKFQGITGNLVRLENPDFERAFKVTSTDATGARYLLTMDMQERFLALRNNWTSDIRAVLLDSSLHLAIPKSTDWFEPDLNTPADDLATLHTFLMRLTVVLRITETLDLNTRIWTKQ